MKKILSLIILTIIITTGCFKKGPSNDFDKIVKKDSITVGVKTDAKPFGFINEETGLNDGFDIDIAKYIARSILGTDKNIEFISVTPHSRIEAITSGKADMVIATMSVTNQRQYFIDFSVPYYVAGQTAAVRKDSGIKTFAELKNKTSIVVMGTTAEENLRRVVPTTKIIGFKTYKEAFDALKEGKGDAFITDETILSDFIYHNKDYKTLKQKISIELYGVGIKKSKDKKLKEAIDIVISRMSKDGTLNYLRKKWHLD